jgi:hypothetical protein
VVLDYIIRNTDRGNDNWLIKYEKPKLVKKEDPEGQLSLNLQTELGFRFRYQQILILIRINLFRRIQTGYPKYSVFHNANDFKGFFMAF